MPLNYAALQRLGLNTEKALMLLMQREVLYARILRRFVEERADISQQLQNTLARNDYDNAAMLVHSLKSLAGTFGAEQLQDICGKLEAQLHARQCTPELLAQFDAELERLMAGLLPLLAEKI